MRSREVEVSHDGAERYEAGRTLTKKWVKEVVLRDDAWQWAVWFKYNGGQCGTMCPYRENCHIGSETCEECEDFEGIQVVTAHSGRVWCRRRKAELKPLPEVIFVADGKERLSFKTMPELPPELCPW